MDITSGNHWESMDTDVPCVRKHGIKLATTLIDLKELFSTWTVGVEPTEAK
jgi:hypothetical protein